MSTVTTLIIALIRSYLKLLVLIAPKAAGRQAYWLFGRPRTRRTVPEAVEAVMARAERFEVEAGGHRVVAYRWRISGDAEPSGTEPGDIEPAAGRPRVMLVHGWESRAARLAVWVEPLLEQGVEVVALDAPAHGASDGHSTDPGVYAEAIGKVAESVGPVTACVGHSLGGLASVLAVAGADLLGRTPLELDRLIIIAGAESGVDAMSTFCDVLGLGQQFLPRVLEGAASKIGRSVSDFDVHRLLADRPIPTLWFHDPEDGVIPFESCQRVLRTCPHVSLETKEGLGHHQIARDPEVIRRGLEFLTGP